MLGIKKRRVKRTASTPPREGKWGVLQAAAGAMRDAGGSF